MLGEVYAGIKDSGIILLCIFIVAVLLSFIVYMIKGTAFLFSSLKAAVVIMIFVVLGYLNRSTIITKQQLADSLCDNADSRRECCVLGRVIDIKEGEGAYKVYIRCTELETLDRTVLYKGHIKLCVYMKDTCDLFPGQVIVIRGKAGLANVATCPGQFDPRKYYRNKGIYFLIFDGELIERTGKCNYISYYLYKIKQTAMRVVESIFPVDKQGIINAMLFGERNDIEKDTKRLYQINGIAHILAISGLHIALVGMSIFRKLRKRLGSYYLSGAIAITLVLLYGMITGFAISTSRAVIMLVIDIIGKSAGRSSDLLTSMGFSCVFLCMFNPFLLYDAGFLLSFGAVCAISIVLPCLKKLLGKLSDNRIIQAFLTSLSINLVTTPIIVYFYYEFPIYAIIINIIIIPLVSVILVFGLISVIMGMVSTQFACYITLPVRFVLEFYKYICIVFEKLPYANINVGRIGIVEIIIYYIILAVLLTLSLWIKKRQRENGKWLVYIKIALIWVSLFVVSVLYIAFRLNSKSRIVFLDVGQGDCILITTGDGTNIMIDGGSLDVKGVGEYRILPALKYYGMSRLDYVFITHGDDDHTVGVEYLLSEKYTGINVKNIVIPKYSDKSTLSDIIMLANKAKVPILEIAPKDRIEADFKLTCLFPTKDFDAEDTNSKSIVLQYEACNIASLFVGDIGEKAEKEIIAANPDISCDVLKVAHHGSKYSSCEEFLNATCPDYACISCGENNRYGHPHEESIERIEAIGGRILRTDELGTIILTLSSSGKLKWEWYR